MRITEAVATIYEQIEADIVSSIPDIQEVFFGTPITDVPAPFAVVVVTFDRIEMGTLSGAYELEPLFTITVVKPSVAGEIPTLVKIADSGALLATLTASSNYAGVCTQTLVENVDLEDSGEALVKEFDFSVTVRFLVVGDFVG